MFNIYTVKQIELRYSKIWWWGKTQYLIVISCHSHNNSAKLNRQGLFRLMTSWNDRVFSSDVDLTNTILVRYNASFSPIKRDIITCGVAVLVLLYECRLSAL